MRPRVLYELSRRLAVLLENGLKENGDGRRVPIFLCHPLDPLEQRETLEASTLGVLYPTRISPEPKLRHAGLALETRMCSPGGRLEPEDIPGRAKDRLRLPGLWVKVRYAFLVAGGSVENQLEAIGAALRTLHDHPYVTLDDVSRIPTSGLDAAEGGAPGEGLQQDRGVSLGGESGEATQGSAGTFPLRLLEEGEGWRELGLAEHHLTISFEVTICIPSERAEVVERVLEREVRLEGQ